MRIVTISDTHNKHKQLTIPDGDMIIHCGDFTSLGRSDEIKDFIKWFSRLPHKYKIMIAGNHDWGLEIDQSQYDKWSLYRYQPHMDLLDIRQEILPLMKANDIIYLNSSSVEIEGIKIYGSPVSPEFHGWAYNRFRGEDIKKEWDGIPDDTNILITHGPPFGILDKTTIGQKHVGCEELAQKIQKLPDLKLHIFGHIHENRGIIKLFNVTYINTSSLDLRYQPYNEQAFVVDYENL